MLHCCESQARAKRTSWVRRGEATIRRGEATIRRGEGRTQQKITLGLASAKDVGLEHKNLHF